MSNKYLALLLIALLLCIATPVVATDINATILLTTNYYGDLHLGYGSSGTSSFLYSPPAGNGIAFATINLREENDPVVFRIIRAGQSDITGTITLVPTGWFSGNVVVNIIGGNSSTKSYTRTPIYHYNEPYTIFYIRTDTDYRLVIVETSRFNYAVSGDFWHPVFAPFILEDTVDAYIILTSNPSQQPITTLSAQSQGSGQFTTEVYYESIQAVRDAEKYTEKVQAGDIWSFLKSFIALLTNAAAQLLLFGTGVITLLIFFKTIALLLFAGQVFLVLVAAYTIIAAILSIHDSDDIFRSIGKFWRMEMKLWRFFMEIFRWVKDMIKWW